MGVCCYILSCEQTAKAAIVDPGGDEQRLLDLVAQAGYDVVHIIATHGHPDHVCGNRKTAWRNRHRPISGLRKVTRSPLAKSPCR
ncbi:MAG: MBL fold metallo-hydrolase [Desulfofustis sp.]